MNRDGTLIPTDDAMQAARALLITKSNMEAPWQLLNAYLALTEGASPTACVDVQKAADDRLAWTVVAVLNGCVVHITADCPDAWEEYNLEHPLDVRDMKAAIYPRTILSGVSSKATVKPRHSGEKDILPHYVAHFAGLGDVEVNQETGAALIGLLRP